MQHNHPALTKHFTAQFLARPQLFCHSDIALKDFEELADGYQPVFVPQH
jgi:hypothetical protein